MKLLITLLLLLALQKRVIALDNDRKVKHKVGVIVNIKKEDNEVITYYKLEKEEEDYKLNFETTLKLKNNAEEILIKLEYEF